MAPAPADPIAAQGSGSPAALSESWARLTLTLLLALPAGCLTPDRLPPVDTSQPGWRLSQGQGVWRSKTGATEIAGEIVLAQHPDGRSIVQFIKPPLSLITARVEPGRWQLEDFLEQRALSGTGSPPPSSLWLALAPSLSGSPPPGPLKLKHLAPGQWRLQDPLTGERLTFYLLSTPQQAP